MRENENGNLPAAAVSRPPCKLHVIILTCNSFFGGMQFLLCLDAVSIFRLLALMGNVIVSAFLALVILQGSPDGETPQATTEKEVA